MASAEAKRRGTWSNDELVGLALTALAVLFVAWLSAHVPPLLTGAVSRPIAPVRALVAWAHLLADVRIRTRDLLFLRPGAA